MSKLFGDYQASLGRTLKKERVLNKSINEAKLSSDSLQDSINVYKSFKDIGYFAETTSPSSISGDKQAITFNFSALENIFGKNRDSFGRVNIGDHPDFEDLGHNEELNHHCVSAFIDIKGSTRLINKYSLSEIRYIKDSLLTLCIYITNFFGGHVQRLQGDGIFVQFVRRDKNERDAVINALNSTSLILQFVKVDLANLLSNQGIEPIKVRVGIDYGPNEDVLWSHYGIPNCSELTTTSLHTDLAAKLQAKARSNRVLIGSNVKQILDLPSKFISVPEKRGSSTDLDYYIIHDPRYNMYEFNWENYLSTFPFFKQNDSRTQLLFEMPEHFLECQVAPEDTTAFEAYNPNMFGIPKGHQIRFQIKRKQRNLTKVEVKEIEWKAINTGKEAEDAEQLEHNFDGNYKDKLFCKTSAAFLGHHLAECKIMRNYQRSRDTLTFPLFIK